MQALILGWDVGGWQGRANAVAAARWSGELSWLGGGELPIPRRAPGLSAADVARRAGAELGDGPAVLAIDAPLAFPRAFRDLLAGGPGLEHAPERELDNPLAYRDTDRAVHQATGKKPLSPAFDKLGNPATVALSHARRWRREGFRFVPQEAQRPARAMIEVYPALLKSRGQRTGALPSWAHRLLPETGEGHLRDAQLCVLFGLAWLLDGAEPDVPRLQGPKDAVDEGWIWLPAE